MKQVKRLILISLWIVICIREVNEISKYLSITHKQKKKGTKEKREKPELRLMGNKWFILRIWLALYQWDILSIQIKSMNLLYMILIIHVYIQVLYTYSLTLTGAMHRVVNQEVG